MIKSERAFTKAMRKMISNIADGKSPYHDPPTDDDCEVLAECISRGLLLSAAPLDGGNVLRTMDGKAHPMVNTQVVPLKGLAFLHPDRTRLRANIALSLSTIAILVSVLVGLPQIISSVKLLINGLTELVHS